MDNKIVVQLIATGGIILTPLLSLAGGYLIYRKVYAVRKRFANEASLYKEALFYREVIEKYTAYCKEFTPERTGKRQEFWDLVKTELEMDAPSLTEPAKIEKRLNELNALTTRLDEVLKKYR
jgi:hypothetical protein